MLIKSITVAVGRVTSLGNYSSQTNRVEVTATIEAGDDVGASIDALNQSATVKLAQMIDQSKDALSGQEN